MCRFIAYLGKPVMADELLIKPKNSLLSQSYHALESEMTVNGDGFGLGWYDKSIREEPGLFRSIRPAWNDENLLYNAAMIKSKCIFGHIRAATNGSVSIPNCHPFHYDRYLMMQNGGIADFVKIKRAIVNRLHNEPFEWIQGQTDTQYIFALFMTIVLEYEKKRPLPLADIKICFSRTFAEIEEMKKAANLSTPSLYNMVLSDGHRLIATRYSTRPEEDTRSLHVARISEFYIGEKGHLRFKDEDEADKSVLIASEVLGTDKGFWKEVPENSCVMVDYDNEVRIEPMA
jgi:glutamine amidotransferase